MDQLRTRALVGEFAVTEALQRMLEGTGFSFEFESPQSVLLTREPVAIEAANPASEVLRLSSASDSAMLSASPVASELLPIDDVVVTGTYIHGALDIASPLVRIEKKDMKGSAYATVQDALQVLTMNSGAAPSDDFSGSNGNYNRGTAPSLRGLGYGATLVLVNGRRQPLAGSDAKKFTLLSSRHQLGSSRLSSRIVMHRDTFRHKRRSNSGR